MCLSDHKTISNMSWNAANEEGITVRYKTSPFITSLPQDTESKIAIMVQDLPIFFFPTALEVPPGLSASWVYHVAHGFWHTWTCQVGFSLAK